MHSLDSELTIKATAKLSKEVEAELSKATASAEDQEEQLRQLLLPFEGTDS